MMEAPDFAEAAFHVGQVIQHKIFGYRGVIVDVDSHFLGTPGWYDNVAKSRPPKDRPWYHVLVDGGLQKTYVAERNLKPDRSGDAINHPEVSLHFERLIGDTYRTRQRNN